MIAWMNKQAIELTLEKRKAHYWSRSAQQNSGLKAKSHAMFRK
jgi:phosphoribosyl-AMP cyclohydrolase